MRLPLAIAIATVLAVPASAERIFPSLPDTYRSGTVEVHLAAFSDGVSGGPTGDGNGGGTRDQIGTGSNCFFCAGAPTSFGGGSSGGTARNGGAVGGTSGGIGIGGNH